MTMKRIGKKDKPSKIASDNRGKDPSSSVSSVVVSATPSSVGELPSPLPLAQASSVQRCSYQHYCVEQNHLEFNIGLQSLEISPSRRKPPDDGSDNSQLTATAPHSGLPCPIAGTLFKQDVPNACTRDVREASTSGHQKREKMGLFRNLRRKFSSFRKAESIECNGYVEEGQSPNVTPNLASSRLKERNRKDFSKTSNLRSFSHSSENLNSHLQKFMSPKFRDWHSNTNSTKEKHSCLSKNFSELQVPESSVHRDDIAFRERVSENADVVIHNKDSDISEPVYEYADCVQCNSSKEPGKIWSLTQELFRLSKFGWYWGPITRNEAEEKLTNQPDGAFLVRDSSDERYLLSLSFRSYGITLHTRIEHCNGMFSFYAQPDSEGYPSIVDLIEHSMNACHTGIFYYSRSNSPDAPQFPVRLTKPVSRFTQVRSLQYLCRFVIRQYTRYDHIQQLPLPTTLKGWIEENQY